MKTWIWAVLLVLVTGCTQVPKDVVESIDVLRDNTHALSERYGALLDRSGPSEALIEEVGAEQAQTEWEDDVLHEKTLMAANNKLADKVYEWAEVNEEEKE